MLKDFYLPSSSDCDNQFSCCSWLIKLKLPNSVSLRLLLKDTQRSVFKDGLDGSTITGSKAEGQVKGHHPPQSMIHVENMYVILVLLCKDSFSPCKNVLCEVKLAVVAKLAEILPITKLLMLASTQSKNIIQSAMNKTVFLSIL